MSSWNFNAERCTCKRKLRAWLENSTFRKINFKCIPYSLFQTLDICKLCSTNSGCKCLQRHKFKEFKSEERAGHAIGPPSPIQCSGNTFSENFPTAGSKCDGTPSYMNPKGILDGRSTSCQLIVVKIPSHTLWKKVWSKNSVSRNASTKTQSRQFETFNYKQAANRKPQFRRPMFMQYFFLVLWCRSTYFLSDRAFFSYPKYVGYT